MALNAQTFAGGKIEVSASLMDYIAKSDDDLAIILGHEVSHEILKQTYLVGQENKSSSLIKDYFLHGGKEALDKIRKLPQADRSFVGPMKESRDNEAQCDRLGVYIARIAGYDVSKADEVWKRFGYYERKIL